MKVGDVFRKEREQRKLTVADAVSRLGIPEAEYEELEGGGSPAEKWGPVLARAAIKLETPLSRLISETGKSDAAKEGQVGPLVERHRERKGVSKDAMAEYLNISREEYESLEAGDLPVERYGRVFLGFAEMIDRSVFDLFYPCGLPLDKLEDYP
jgi:transcriptional regulator with XRE-family HTH domain